MTQVQETRFSNLLSAQIERGPLMGQERQEYDRLADLWEQENAQPRSVYADFT